MRRLRGICVTFTRARGYMVFEGFTLVECNIKKIPGKRKIRKARQLFGLVRRILRAYFGTGDDDDVLEIRVHPYYYYFPL